MESIGEKIAELRKERKFTQKDVAQKLNIDVRTLRNIENGSVEPTIDKIEKLAELFKIDINDIVSYKQSSINQKIYNDNSQDHSKNNAYIIEIKNEKLLESYQQQIELLKNQIADKNEIINFLKNKS